MAGKLYTDAGFDQLCRMAEGGDLDALDTLRLGVQRVAEHFEKSGNPIKAKVFRELHAIQPGYRFVSLARELWDGMEKLRMQRN